jgi:hypothetical protein
LTEAEARNKVQFQKGLNEAKFDALSPAENSWDSCVTKFSFLSV